MMPFGMSGPGDMPHNPFAFQQLFFEVDAVNETTGARRDGVISVTMPSSATERQARRTILDMGYRCGWHFKTIKRVEPPAE